MWRRLKAGLYRVLIGSRAGLALLGGLRGLLEFCKTLPGNLRFRREHPGYPVPPRLLMFDAHRHMDFALYRSSGEEHARLYADLFARHRRLDASTQILEWGCGTARILRHLGGALGAPVRLFGTDYNPDMIRWCQRHLPGITFAGNGLQPPLPFAAGMFDIAYCRSVLTHLSVENIDAWIAELRRVVKPGGLISFSAQGDSCLPKMSPAERAQYQAGEPVTRSVEEEGKKYFTAFHPPAFIRRRWIAPATLLEAMLFTGPNGSQDVWLLRNP